MRRHRFVVSFRLAGRAVVACALGVTAGIGVMPAGRATAATNATVVTVCRDAELRQAISTVPAGGTILFGCNGTIAVNPNLGAIEIHKEVTLDATGHSVSISGGQQTQIFFVATRGTVTMRGLTLENGLASNYSFGGGAVFVGGTRLVVDHMRFVSNRAGNLDNGGATFSGAGGAISVFGTAGQLVVANSEFVGNSVVCGINCHASGGGGAISLRNGGPSLIQKSIFRGNSEIGGDGGGAIAATYYSLSNVFSLGAVTIDHSMFTNNTSNTGGDSSRPVRGGGAVMSLSRSLTISDSQFKTNTADVNLVIGEGIQPSGGAVRSGVVSEGPRLPTSITNTIFDSNVAHGLASEGGAVAVDDQPVHIGHSVLIRNQAARGAAVSIFGDGTTIADSQFISNLNIGGLGEDGAVWTAGRMTFTGTQLVTNTSGCYLAVLGSTAGKVIDGGKNIEVPGNSCGFGPIR